MKQAATFFLLGMLLAGCSSTPGGGSNQTHPANEKSSGKEEPAGDVSAIELRVVDKETYKEALAEHEGSVVLVDFWASWCTNCKEQFPHTLELKEKYAKQGLKVVTFSLDDEDDYPAAKKFLAEKEAADLTNLVSASGASQESMLDFNLAGVPHYRLYDRQGKERWNMFGEPKEIEGKIEELLAE